MGRLIGTTTQYSFLPGFNFQNGYTYDAASNRKTLGAPDGSTNTYNYDTLNRLATLTNSLTGQFGFGYDALNRRMQLTRPNGINTNYRYDSVSPAERAALGGLDDARRGQLRLRFLTPLSG